MTSPLLSHGENMNSIIRLYLQIIKRARQKYLLEDYAKKDQPLGKILSDVDAALVVSIQMSRNFWASL